MSRKRSAWTRATASQASILPGEAGPVRSPSVPLRGLVAELGLELVDLGRGHLPGRRDLTVLDPPEPEGSRDVAVLVELHGPDHPDVADRLALLEETERLPE